MSYINSSNVGLFLSILGSIIILIAFITSNPKVMSTSHGRVGGHSSIAFFTSYKSRVEAIAGLIYLIIGFILQINGITEICTNYLIMLVVLALIFFISSFKIFTFLSARATLKNFIDSIPSKNCHIRAIAEDFKNLKIKDPTIKNILDVQTHEDFKTEELKKKEWKLVKRLAEKWHIKIDINHIFERE